MPELQPNTGDTIVKEGEISVITRPSDPEKLESIQALNNKAAALGSIGFNCKWMGKEDYKKGSGFTAEKVMGPDLIKRMVFIADSQG